jgi:2-phosphoglycerate kinase
MALIVITGPPGAGKSTVAALVARSYPRSVLIEGDAFFAFLDRGAIEPWLPEANDQNDVVIQAAAAATGRFASNGYLTVYEGIVGPWFLPTFLDSTGLASLHYVVLAPNVETCVERVAHRTGHGFRDEAATRKMHAEFERAEVATRHLLTDAENTPESTASEVIRRVEQELLVYPQ